MFQHPGANRPCTGPLSGHGPMDSLSGDHDLQESRRLAVHQQLSATRRELDELRSLLDTLPEIFERKFEERLSPMLTQRQRLLEQNEQARAQLQLCGDAADTNLQLSDGQAGPRWGQALRHALGWTPEQRSA